MFSLSPLPYASDALEGVIDEKTMMIHHGKHHQAYVNNLNNALEKENYQKNDLHELLHDVHVISSVNRQTVINNAGGHFNHTLFWSLMKPGGKNENLSVLGEIEKYFGSLEELKKQMNTAGMSRFGSGWVWLVQEKGELKVISTANQDCPIMFDQKPIIGIDVWEHAYYLRYQNLRADYLNAWWELCNWKEAEKNFLTTNFSHLEF